MTNESVLRRAVETRQASLDARRGGAKDSNTSKLWNRNIKEYELFCKAEPGSTLHTVKIKEDKVVTDGTVTKTMVSAFIADYLIKRPLLAGPDKAKEGYHLDVKSVTTFIEALQDHKGHQIAIEPYRFVTEEQRMEVIYTRELQTIVKSHGQMTMTRKVMDPEFNQCSVYWKKLGYNPEQYQNMVRWGFHKGYGAPSRYKEYGSLLAHLSVVLPHQGMARVDDAKGVTVAAIQLQELGAGEGPMPCPQLIYSGQMKQSNGKFFHLFLMPHIDSFCCGFVAIGWSLVYTHAILKQPECDYEDNADWKGLCVFPGRAENQRGVVGSVDRKTQAQYDAIKTVYKNVLKTSGGEGEPIVLSKVASLARRSAAQESTSLFSYENVGGLAEVAAAGRWAGGGSRHLVNSYLTNPAMETTRQAAGQPPLGGAFNIARLSLLPTRAQLRGLVPDLCAANTKQENLSATERNQNLYLSGRAMETCIQHFVAHVSLNFEDTHPCTGILNVPFFKPGTAAHPSVFAQYRKAHTAAMAEHQRNEITQARESLQLVDTLTARAVSKFASAISCSSALLSSSSSSSSSSLSPSSSSSSSSSYPATSSLSTSSRRPNVSPNTNRLLQVCPLHFARVRIIHVYESFFSVATPGVC